MALAMLLALLVLLADAAPGDKMVVTGKVRGSKIIPIKGGTFKMGTDGTGFSPLQFSTLSHHS